MKKSISICVTLSLLPFLTATNISAMNAWKTVLLAANALVYSTTGNTHTGGICPIQQPTYSNNSSTERCLNPSFSDQQKPIGYSNQPNVPEYITSAINKISEDGFNALHESVLSEDKNALQMLLESDATCSITDNKHGFDALHWAAILDDLSVATILLHNKNCREQINAQDKNGFTALHYAVVGGSRSTQLIKLLLDNGADPRIKTNNGWTALDVVIPYDTQGTVKKLFDAAQLKKESSPSSCKTFSSFAKVGWTAIALSYLSGAALSLASCCRDVRKIFPNPKKDLLQNKHIRQVLAPYLNKKRTEKKL